MVFIAEINVMPHKEILDPQGKAVLNSLKHMELTGVNDVRVGRHVTLSLTAANEAEAREKVDAACQKLLANLIVETYQYELKQADA
jgi:phosphoribosylformylglycinamidine synthase subunit PurS